MLLTPDRSAVVDYHHKLCSQGILSMKDNPLSEAGAQYRQSLHADDENEEGSRKRGRWVEQENNTQSFINFDFNRTISRSPYPSTEHLLSLGNKVPLAADSTDLELSIKASTTSTSMQRMGDLRSCNFGSFGAASQASPARSLTPHHQNQLIARLLAAASASSNSRDTNAQALHRLNHGQAGMPLLAYTVHQEKQYTDITNQSLTRVNANTYTSHQGILRDDTTLGKPYYSMMKDTSINLSSSNDNKLHTSIEKNHAMDEGLSTKVAMQKHVKVVMEGRSIERKVCLDDFDSYESLGKALFDMYGNPDDKHLTLNVSHTSTSLQYGTIPGYKIAYQDHEGDLLLVGDLPWREFTQVAKQIKILPMRKPKHHLNGA